jgi:hypothetical protein
MSDNSKKSESKYPVNMTETPFPMRGDLAKREPQWVAQWQQDVASQEDRATGTHIRARAPRCKEENGNVSLQ